MKIQKHLSIPRLLNNVTVLYGVLLCGAAALGQGTITFNSSSGLGSTYYSELGVWFHVVVPQGTSHDDMGIVGPIPPGGNAPQNSTPYMGWFRQYNPYDYVSLSLTDGSIFGLSSVQLADPNAPSLAPVSISFIGYVAGGLTVTNTFTTPGQGATTFETYTFNSDFASGLTSVDILAPRWAMDNLVVTVPEPSTAALAVLGLCLGVGLRRLRA